MRIPIKWLAEYVDIKGVSDTQLSDALTLSGTENEILKAADFPGIVVGEILEIQKHENADKLKVTKVNVGAVSSVISSEVEKSLSARRKGSLHSSKDSVGMTNALQIVCGAPNIEVGQKVPVALVGADMGEFQIKEAEIRGVKSFGMLCSESELGISDDHSGIMILDPRAKIGQPLGEALNIGGTVIEAELTPNRSDCFSMIGIAREASASLGKKMKNLNFARAEIKSSQKIKVEVQEQNLCPRYMAKVVEGIKIGPSPKWMQERLEASGVRPINNIVDVTNYVMLEWGQPMHAFDFDKISSAKIPNTKYQIPKIVVRKARKGETLETLDGAKRSLTEKDLVIADAKKPIAVAGVMGGANSEVDEKTTAIILEAAVFDGASVRKTAQRLGLRTEASNRFEKGVPLQLPEIAIERAAQLIIDSADGRAGEIVDVLSAWPWVQHVGVTGSSVQEFLGVEIDNERMISILKSLGFEAEKFDIKKEARKHVGKPYVFGAKFKTHGDMAFDCSYLTDYIYSQIGNFIGYTSLAQYKIGTAVQENELKPGDILFVKGHIDKSATDHYFTPDGRGGYEKVVLSKKEEVGHNGLYIGDGRVVHARSYEYDAKTDKWKKAAKAEVVEESAEVFTKNPEYLGARRFIESSEEYLAIKVPWWRLDVRNKEDIFEEIGRVYGYNNIPSVLPNGQLPLFEENRILKLSRKIKQILSGVGFSEVYNYSFTSAKNLSGVGEDVSKVLKLKNPISPELEYMRTILSGSLLQNIALNQDNYKDIKIFEIASTYLPQKNALPKEEKMLCLAVKSSSKINGQPFFDIKGALEIIFESENISNYSYKKGSSSFLGQSQEILIDGKKIGLIGLVSEKTKNTFGLKSEVAVAEISLEKTELFWGKTKEFHPIPKYPIVLRDLNVVIDQRVSAAELVEAINFSQTSHLSGHKIAEIYQGKELPDNKKSVTINLSFSSEHKTLLESDVQDDLEKIMKKITKLGGQLRS
jgi:phenylalanyl-tRNA synthetase beta subunit